ncbi:hypothetical protein L1987_06346 [Smallanthus sonchifolius]|uniref:Uncharacterized protein n=1 Tax=Smallanthus sonchifolius TaxID=185202 RepID=A0ACB9JXW9_9ASTR|nr:hypothetical protein L1987_06346 [Smallanthus sonchifolius]
MDVDILVLLVHGKVPTFIRPSITNTGGAPTTHPRDGTKEFTEDAIAKLEDDELLNEEDGTALMCHRLYI